MTVTTRFAPSPTGVLHLGGARTAVFAWLFARQQKGRFLLRIEDTDAARSNTEALESILEGLQWLGLSWDEAPWFQSQRLSRYADHAHRLFASGKAYGCLCSKSRLETLRAQQLRQGLKPKYDHCCRNLKINPWTETEAVLRFKMPLEGVSTFQELSRHDITVQFSELDDWVLWRQSAPTYNFCVVVDDWESGVTHLIRGDDHLDNTHRQKALAKALGAPDVATVHLPMVMNHEGRKLSKRDGATNLLEYRSMGFLAEGVLNYLARLGASFGLHGSGEILTSEQLIQGFSLKHLSKSPSCLDEQKLLWVNGQHLKAMTIEALYDRLKSQMKLENFEWFRKAEAFDRAKLLAWIQLYQPRCVTLLEVQEILHQIYSSSQNWLDEERPGEIQEGQAIMKPLALALTTLDKWQSASLSSFLKAHAKNSGTPFSKLGPWLRWVLLKCTEAPNISEVMAILGKEDTLLKLDDFLAL